jgi:hypothetical protein
LFTCTGRNGRKGSVKQVKKEGILAVHVDTCSLWL